MKKFMDSRPDREPESSLLNQFSILGVEQKLADRTEKIRIDERKAYVNFNVLLKQG